MTEAESQSERAHGQTDGASRSSEVEADAGQAEVVRFLSELTSDIVAAGMTPSSVSCTSSASRRSIVVTHGARLFLYDGVVLKLKRAVHYSYLDMRELASRERLCRRELELNRAVVPGLYVDVLSINRSAQGRLSLGGAGEPIEWVVRMQRFDESCVLDWCARHGQLTAELGARIGRSVARYHAGLKPINTTDGQARLHEIVRELDCELHALQPGLPQAMIDRFLRQAERRLDLTGELLDTRACAGFVRRCHGDLHLRNLLLVDGEPLPFDALEFDERLATTDVLYDVAFTLMDLASRDLPEAANAAFNAYLLHAGSAGWGALPALPLFLACRAAIRAMTSAQAAQSAGHADEAQTQGWSEALDYLQHADRYLHQRAPVLVGVGGLSGSGKSTLARQLAARLGDAPGAVLLRSDAERKLALGLDELTVLPADRYTQQASNDNYDLLLGKAGQSLQAGFSVIVDATFLYAAERQALEAVAAQCSVAFAGLWLHAPAEVLRSRVTMRVNDASDATPAVLERQLPLQAAAIDWCSIDASGDRENTMALSLERLSRCLAQG